MAGGENAAFLRDPLRYIQNKPISIWNFLDVAKGTVQRENNAGRTWIRGVGRRKILGTNEGGRHVIPGWSLIALDFVKRSARTVDGRNIRFIVVRLAQSAFPAEWKVTRRINLGDFHNTPNPIQGYFFPYLIPPAEVGPPQNWNLDRDFGHVDFPRLNPQIEFVFTGGMNGCAIVITESPLGRHYYRAYHYPSPGQYPYWRNRNRWPHTVLRWFGFETYGGREQFDANNKLIGMDAFVFLRYDRNRAEWCVYSQLHDIPQEHPDLQAGGGIGVKLTEMSIDQGPYSYRFSALPDRSP